MFIVPQGVLQGASPEIREAAAEGLGELVDVTTEETLKPFVVQITGPLIRIIGDRILPSIKAAILATMGALISKAGAALKPFLPQLQTTFLKCLQDKESQPVRQRAAANLGALTALSARVDQLATDLANTAKCVAAGFVCAITCISPFVWLLLVVQLGGVAANTRALIVRTSLDDAFPLGFSQDCGALHRRGLLVGPPGQAAILPLT